MARGGARPARWGGRFGSPLAVLLVLSLAPLAALAAGASASPVPSFPPFLLDGTATPTSGPIPLTVAFSASASGGVAPYSYNWSFGDTSPNATTAAVNHTYRWVAVFVANVSAVDALGEIASMSFSINAVPPPLGVGLSAYPSALAAGTTTYLETTVAGGSPPYAYAWNGLPPGCPTQSVKNLSCTPQYGGSYVVTVSVTDAQGMTQTATVGLVVSGPGPPRSPGAPPSTTDFTYPVLIVLGVGAALVVVAAVIGRRARRKRAGPGA